MTLKQWWAQIRFDLVRAKLTRQNPWGRNAPWGDDFITLDFLLRQVEKVTFRPLSPAAMRTYAMHSRVNNVDLLMQILRRVRYCMDQNDPLVDEKSQEQPVLVYNLDDYFVSTLDTQIGFEEIRRVLQEELRPVISHVAIAMDETKHTADYYQRRLRWVIPELRLLLETLLLLSDQRISAR